MRPWHCPTVQFGHRKARSPMRTYRGKVPHSFIQAIAAARPTPICGIVYTNGRRTMNDLYAVVGNPNWRSGYARRSLEARIPQLRLRIGQLPDLSLPKGTRTAFISISWRSVPHLQASLPFSEASRSHQMPLAIPHLLARNSYSASQRSPSAVSRN